MTIAVAVRTSSAVVFATDSKLTGSGLAGIAADGSLNWVRQTYDNATKVVHDRNRHLMALAAGTVNIGGTTAGDFIASYAFPTCPTVGDEDQAIQSMLDQMDQQRRAFWSRSGAPSDQWPGPTMLIALASSDRPRIWAVTMDKALYTHREVMQEPAVRFEGSCEDVFSLLYGIRFPVIEAFAKELGESDESKISTALKQMKVLRPVDQINLSTMPLQDAIDLAVFLANVQIEMDRFMPGDAACGGPIDVMVLRMVPTPEILSYPGKQLHHPNDRGRISG